MGPRIGGFFADPHRGHGVTFAFGRGVTGFRGTGKVETVITSDGQELRADFVASHRSKPSSAARSG